MMLWYKTWCETRTRLAITALTLLWICAVIVLAQGSSRNSDGQPLTYAAYVWNAVYKDYLRTLFLLLTMVLGGGTLLQDRAEGTAGLTLSLPVSRSRLLAVRAAVGLGEVLFLAFIPVAAIPLLSVIAGQRYPVLQAVQFGLLWAVCGTLVFCLSLLVSALHASEYSAWVVSFLLVLMYEGIVNFTSLRSIPALDLFATMSGKNMPYFDAETSLIVGPLPWASLFVFLCLSGLLVIGADRALRRLDA
jgi:ABC-type transport system involved in multi-copper enzyme maturation permease subunit